MGNQSEADDSSPSLTTIFVVEDDADLGYVLLRFLEEEVPCRVVLATDGFEVLKLVRSIAPHLFLVDYNLPSMNGLELVDHLRAIPTLEQTPIVLMSARMPRDGVKQRQLPAIHKPFDLNHLLQVVREQLPASSIPLAIHRNRCSSTSSGLGTIPSMTQLPRGVCFSRWPFFEGVWAYEARD